MLGRQDLKYLQLDLIRQQNLRLPDLRLQLDYDINSAGSRLDGPGSDNAVRNLGSNRFNDWYAGLILRVPIGNRFADASVRSAKLRLAQSHWALREDERKAVFALTNAYQLVIQDYELVQSNRAQREAYGEQLRARYQDFLAGRPSGTLDILLEAQRFWSTALSGEYNAIAQYNYDLAFFEFCKGTLLKYDNVTIAEGPLPCCAQVRAVEHERERTAALVKRERAMPIPHPPCDWTKGEPGLPVLPANEAPAMPSLLEGGPKVPLVNPEQMAIPRNTPPAVANGASEHNATGNHQYPGHSCQRAGWASHTECAQCSIWWQPCIASGSAVRQAILAPSRMSPRK